MGQGGGTGVGAERESSNLLDKLKGPLALFGSGLTMAFLGRLDGNHTYALAGAMFFPAIGLWREKIDKPLIKAMALYGVGVAVGYADKIYQLAEGLF